MHGVMRPRAVAALHVFESSWNGSSRYSHTFPLFISVIHVSVPSLFLQFRLVLGCWVDLLADQSSGTIRSFPLGDNLSL